MKKFRKKPVEIEAVKLTESSIQECIDFIGDQCQQWQDQSGRVILNIFTLEGVVEASLGDWIIRGIKGEFYPCKPDIFELTYEEVK